MKTLKVPGMMCQMCVKRITAAMSKEGITVQIDLSAKTVVAPAESVIKVIEILADLGFDAEV